MRGIKSFALISDFHFEFVAVTVEDYFNRLRFVLLIAVDHRVRYCFAHSHFDSKGRSSGTPQFRMKSVTAAAASRNRLNVAGQNESSRLIGHKRRGLSRRDSRFGCC